MKPIFHQFYEFFTSNVTPKSLLKTFISKIVFKILFLIFDEFMRLEFRKCLCNVSTWISTTQLSLIRYYFSWLNKYRYPMLQSLNILVLLKAKLHTRKKRSRQTYMRWGICEESLHRVCPSDFDSYRQWSNTINILICTMPSCDYSMMSILLLHMILKIARLARLY